jgi:hypothetical protein
MEFVDILYTIVHHRLRLVSKFMDSVLCKDMPAKGRSSNIDEGGGDIKVRICKTFAPTNMLAAVALRRVASRTVQKLAQAQCK